MLRLCLAYTCIVTNVYERAIIPYQDGALFRYASGELLEIAAERFSMRDMSRITHAFARAGVWDEPVFRYQCIYHQCTMEHMSL
jgi:hypothetical protein